MNVDDQKAGEARVRELVVVPLERLGLTKPAGLTKARFSEMLDEMCSMLAYMTGPNLQRLCLEVSANPAGKDRDRFPILNKILPMASKIQEPEDTGSPLVRAVFASDVGSAAFRDGYAPELFNWVKAERKFPTMWNVTTIKQEVGVNVMRFNRLQGRANIDDPKDRKWFDRRCAVLARLLAWREEELGRKAQASA